MSSHFKSLIVIIAVSLSVACQMETHRTATNAPPASLSPPPANRAPSTAGPALATNESTAITLPVLDALFSDEAFQSELRSRLELTDEQISSLRKTFADEVAKLRRSNTENESGSLEASWQNAIQAIREAVGAEKLDRLLALARERWNTRSVRLEAVVATETGPTMLKGPNAVPKDTRIVVNIPAFRMDVFSDGTLLKSYKIGIGYQQFPLPTGFRKAEMIIFNPTWTQPNESWASNPGEVVPAGSKGNPLGPIKIPIGGANLIHGGKPLAKIGTFASHGCVGLTNDEVKDFAKALAEAANTELKEDTIASFLKKKTRTQVVKLSKVVPVELRYETVVIENGQLHIYRDVYNKNTNTEENLRAAFEANSISFDSLGQEEKTQALDALNVMSLRPKKQPIPTVVKNENSAGRKARLAEMKAEAERQRKLRNQKEIVVDVASLSGKGYPPPKDLNTGAGSIVSNAGVPTPKRPRKNPTPEPQSTPGVDRPPRNTAGPR